jgi:hypothetical protein
MKSRLCEEDSAMSKLYRVTFALLVLLLMMFIAAPMNAQEGSGCKSLKFVGSYTNSVVSNDIWGDGSSSDAHTALRQLTLHIDGTATQEWSGGPDTMLSFGLTTTAVGSWKCRHDGSLVVTLIHAAYLPTTDAINHPTTVPDPPPPVDLFLFANTRTTSLFTVTDDNILTRTQMRARNYDPAEDPSDPDAGRLGRLNTAVLIYKRVVASDADLVAP